MQSARAVLYCNLWSLWLHSNFPTLSHKGTIFRKYLLDMKWAFCFSLKLLSETFLILGRIQIDITINVNRSSFKVPVILFRFYSNLNFPYKFSKKSSNIKFHKNPSNRSRTVPCGQPDRPWRSSQSLFAILRKRVIRGTDVVTSISHSHRLFLLRSILILSSYFLIRFLGGHFEDTSYFHISTMSPVHYRNIHLKSVPFFFSITQFIITLLDKPCFGSQCTTLLILASSILFNRRNTQQEIHLMVWNEVYLRYVYSGDLYVFQKKEESVGAFMFLLTQLRDTQIWPSGRKSCGRRST
jgi:hypothetical protein